MSNPINKLLDESDRIKELSDDAVKDIFVRVELWKRNKNKYSDYSSESFKEFMSQLKASDESDNLYNAIRVHCSFDLQSKMNKSDMSPEEFLWDHWTDSSIDEETRVRLCRQYLDNTVSGGCGMPVHKIVRDNMKAWKGL